MCNTVKIPSNTFATTPYSHELGVTFGWRKCVLLLVFYCTVACACVCVYVCCKGKNINIIDVLLHACHLCCHL